MKSSNMSKLRLEEVSFITKLAGFEYTKYLSGNFKDAGIPVIQGRNIKNGILNYDSMKFIDVALSNKLPRSQVRKNTILLSYVGTVGDVYFHSFDKRLHLGSNVAKIEPYESAIYPKFLYYSLKSPFFVEGLVSKTKGSVQDNINMKDIRSIQIWVPDLKVQKSIANILSSLDDKIELNNKINKNLEEIAQTLYKRWFVDFEFPNENGEPYKSSGGEMVDSELGMIPKGWEVKTVGDICTTVLGGTPSRSNNEYWNGNINWINSGEVNKLRIILASEKITWLGLNNSSTKLMPKKTTVIAITGATLGAVSLLEIESCANQSVIGIYESKDYPYTFVYGLIINKIKDIIGRQTGGAQQHINKNDVNSFKIVVPVKSLIMSFHKNTDAFHKIIATNMFANVNLSKIRDELLPKLMSGEIEVPVEE